MKPRVLLLTPQLPYPPEQGTSLRNYNILRGLVQRYDVTLMSFVTAPPSAEALEKLSECRKIVTVPVPERTLSGRVKRMLIDPLPDMAHRLRSAAFNQELVDLLRQSEGGSGKGEMPYDVIQIEGIEMAFALEIVRSNIPDSRVIFDDHNAEYELQRRSYLADRTNLKRLHAALYSKVQAGRLRDYERKICNDADHVVVVSDHDYDLLGALNLQTPVSVIPNSIDVREYTPNEIVPEDYDLVFVGKMDYRPNVDAVLWFHREVWPLLQIGRPNLSWAIVGKKPHARLDKIGEQTGITITGRVNQVQPYLHGSRICIMPFRVGSGTRLKLIEAMASGKAIVSTTVGAEGFDVESGKQLLIVDEPAAFADTVLALLDDPGRRRELGAAASTFARQYDWRVVAPSFYRIIDSLLNGE